MEPKKAKANTTPVKRTRKPKPQPKVSFREKLIRWLGGVPAPKPKGVKKQAVKAYVRKPGNGNGAKVVTPKATMSEESKVSAEVQAVLDYAESKEPVASAKS